MYEAVPQSTAISLKSEVFLVVLLVLLILLVLVLLVLLVVILLILLVILSVVFHFAYLSKLILNSRFITIMCRSHINIY